MKIGVAGAAGAFGVKHLDALANIPDVEVSSIIGSPTDNLDELAERRSIPHTTTELAESLARDDVDGVILATPTPTHAAQAIQCMKAGKHVLVEIPMADNITDARELVATQKQTGLITMAGHVRRFNPSHQWLHRKIKAGELSLQQMDVQTHFFRRNNINALGESRAWTDHLLWHHACHTVDLFQYQTAEIASEIFGMQGPKHAELKIAMDMVIGLKTPSGKLCNLSLSFNNNGPFGTTFRYICDNGTYIARYDDLFDGNEQPIDLSGVAPSSNGIELIDREFVSAILESREPNASLRQCLPAMETLEKIERQLELRG
jgi:2-hydroxy-4-carboxymuconate semialdehyde hemiacetal dehydrogenase